MPRSRLLSAVALVVFGSIVGGCADSVAFYPRPFNHHDVFAQNEPLPEISVLNRQTLPGIGAGQGVAVRGRFVYVFGDAETGIVREYTFDPETTTLEHTGRDIRLTSGDTNLLPHPTGLAFHPTDRDMPVLIGDTVRKVGTLFWIDFDRALADGTLDHAVIRRVEDDVSSDGCRPEYVRYQNRWVVATSDHNATPNMLRLYDPDALRVAERTSDPGVLIHAWECGPFVQSIRFTGEDDSALLVQNQIRGLRYRLTHIELDPASSRVPGRVLDMPYPRDELEGFVMLSPEIGVMVSAMRQDNMTFVRVVP